jgi:hypothetical protein
MAFTVKPVKPSVALVVVDLSPPPDLVFPVFALLIAYRQATTVPCGKRRNGVERNPLVMQGNAWAEHDC